MANKHSQAFIEVVTRFYVPLDHDLKDIEGISLADLLTQGKVQTFQPKKKGASNAKSKAQ